MVGSPTGVRRSIPRAASRRRRRSALASVRDGASAGSSAQIRSARSQLRSRPSREATATSPRGSMISSIFITFLPLVHPLDRHGRSQVSGRARAGNGPSRRSSSRMSSRAVVLVANQVCGPSCQSSNGTESRQAAISARYRAMSSIGRSLFAISTSEPSPTAASRSLSWKRRVPSRDQSTRPALVATAAVRSTWRLVRCRTTSSRSVGRGSSSSCARTAIRRAWRRLSCSTTSVIVSAPYRRPRTGDERRPQQARRRVSR